MRIKKILRILVICMETLLITSCQSGKEIHILVFSEMQKNLLKNCILVKNYNVKIVDNDTYLTLNKVDEKILIDLISILSLRIDILKDNVANSNTTRTVEGGPFLRSYLKITAENGIEIVKDTDTPTRLVYDPTHPDAIREGENKGFVKLPNIDVITEYYELIGTIQLYNSIVDFIKNNYKQILIEKIDIMTIEEIEHNIKVENMLGLLLKNSFENNIHNR